MWRRSLGAAVAQVSGGSNAMVDAILTARCRRDVVSHRSGNGTSEGRRGCRPWDDCRQRRVHLPRRDYSACTRRGAIYSGNHSGASQMWSMRLSNCCRWSTARLTMSRVWKWGVVDQSCRQSGWEHCAVVALPSVAHWPSCDGDFRSQLWRSNAAQVGSVPRPP